jgi:hypothetical protein
MSSFDRWHCDMREFLEAAVVNRLDLRFEDADF